MTEIYDMALLVGDLVLILVFIWFLINAGMVFLNEFSNASIRMLQEFISGYASMSNFAPSSFSAEIKFPAVNHMLKIYSDPQLVSVKAGTKGTATLNPVTGEQTKVMLTFVKKPPFPYFLSDAVILSGDCVETFCAFSGEKTNKIKFSKNGASLSVLLNRESAAAGSFYKLGDNIFSGECGSKIYTAYYMFGGTNSVRVEVNEDGKIIKDGESDTHEISVGETKTINNLKITLYSVNPATNIASMTAECAG